MIAHVLLCCLLCVNTACDSNIEKEPEKEPVGNDYLRFASEDYR